MWSRNLLERTYINTKIYRFTKGNFNTLVYDKREDNYVHLGPSCEEYMSQLGFPVFAIMFWI
jgi:hypothetical protein